MTEWGVLQLAQGNAITLGVRVMGVRAGTDFKSVPFSVFAGGGGGALTGMPYGLVFKI